MATQTQQTQTKLTKDQIVALFGELPKAQFRFLRKDNSYIEFMVQQRPQIAGDAVAFLERRQAIRVAEGRDRWRKTDELIAKLRSFAPVATANVAPPAPPAPMQQAAFTSTPTEFDPKAYSASLAKATDKQLALRLDKADPKGPKAPMLKAEIDRRAKAAKAASKTEKPAPKADATALLASFTEDQKRDLLNALVASLSK